MHPSGDRQYDEERALRLWITLARAYLTISREVGSKVTEYGLTVPRFGILEARHHLGPLSLGELADKLLVTGGNITYVMDRLEEQGLVYRKRSDEDRRVVKAYLTDEGRERIHLVRTPAREGCPLHLVDETGAAPGSALARRAAPSEVVAMTDSRSIPLVALLLAVVAAYPAQAQDGPFLDVTGRLGNETAPSFLNFAGPTEGEAPEVLLFQPVGGQKSPAAATLFSILVPGLGQMYAGDGRRGAGILGGTLAFPLVGLGLYHGMCEIGEVGCGFGAVLGVIHGIAGALVYGYGVIDAAPTAHRMNARRAGMSFQVAPTLGLPGRSGEGIGLVLRLSAPLPR